jgi:DNA-binding SARP family transcriptional activator
LIEQNLQNCKFYLIVMIGLRLQFLGGFNVSFDGSPVPGFHQPRLQALLAYLLLNRQVPQSRSAIAFLFWPDSSEKQARTNLRRLLHTLRHTLPQSDHYLVLTTETIAWRNEVPLVLDVEQFEAQIEKASAVVGEAHQQKALNEAVAAYAGDLLPGFYDEWILAERERLRSIYAWALTQLSALYEAERDYQTAVEAARRLLQLDVIQESTHRLLMHLHLLNNDRAAALAVYHRCSTVLREELGVDPSPLTEELYRRVLQLETAVEDSPRSIDLFPLIGRNQEWKQLDQVWREVQKSGPATLYLIQGEAGIGKTRLAEELVNKASRLGLTALYTRAYDAEGAGPYAPIVDLLRVVGNVAMLDNLEPVWLTEVARLLPELRDERPDIPPPQPITEAWQRQRFQEGLVRGVLAAGQPLLIHFDDLHWCDPETLAWLRFLLGYDRQGRLLVAGTVRDDEIEFNHPLKSLRFDLEHKGRCRVVNLAPLSFEEVAQLAAEVVGQTLTLAQIGRLFMESEGSPLFLIEMLRAGSAEGATEEIGEWLDDAAPVTNGGRRLPSKVQAVIRWRLSQLTPEAHELAATASVIGRRFQHELLASVGDLNEQALVRSLDELWRRRIIREKAAGDYDFSHDRLREVAYGQISPMQRRYLHKRVAQTIESEHAAKPGPIAGRIAHHYEQAGAGAQARPFFEQAGRYAAARFDNDEAARCFGRALELARHDEVPGKDVAALYVRLGRVLELESQFERAMENYIQMEDLARQYGDQSMLLTSKVAQIVLLATPTSVHDVIRGEALIDEALALAHRLDDQVAEARLLWTRLLIYGFLGRFSEAITSGERALALARKHNLREQLAFVLNDLGYRCYRQIGRLRRARELLQEASELWRELSNLPMLADSLSALCVVSVDAGEYELALTYSAEAYQICQSIGNLWGQSYSLLAIGWVHWEQGRPDRAISTMEECIRLGERAGFLGAQFRARVELSLVLADLGADERSMETIGQAVSVAKAQFSHNQLFLLAIIAQLHLRHGRLAEAEAAIEQVKKDPGWKERVLKSTCMAEATLALRQSKYERALTIAEKLISKLGQSEMKSSLPEFLYLQGCILQATGQRDAAGQCLQETRTAAAALGSKRILWQVLFSLSQLEDDPIEIQDLRQQAQEIVEYIANHTDAPELRASFLNRSEVRDLLSD